jgi:spore germination protein YaaH
MRHYLLFGVCGVLGLLSDANPAASQGPEALWYATGRDASTQAFLAHADKISIVAPQVFVFDSDGAIKGKVDPRMVEAAHAKKVKLVPLVMNPGFSQSMIHRILNVAAVRHRAVRNVAALCRDNHLDGIQFDIENLNVVDRAAFTAFVRETADSLHHLGCTLSAAVVPRSSEDPGPTAFHKWMFENWRGAYDYKALADAMDFISYMTYAEHTGGTTPGPVAGYPWMEQDLKYILSLGVPPSKISLGLATYSDYWYPTYDAKKGERGTGRDISYAEAMRLLSTHGLQTTWDEAEKSPWVMWEEAGVMNYLWIEDARSFQAKLALVSQYHLRGYSVWVLGLEDPKTWDIVGAVAK